MILQGATAIKWLRGLGGPGLLVIAIADGSPVPMPSGSTDIVTILLAASHANWWGIYAALATVGTVVGGFLTYETASMRRLKWLEERAGIGKSASVFRLMQRHGALGLALGSLLPPPFPLTLMEMAAGVARVPRRSYLAALTAGRGIKFFLLAYLGATYGRRVAHLFREYQPSGVHVLIAAAILVALLGGLWWWRSGGRRGEPPPLPGPVER